MIIIFDTQHHRMCVTQTLHCWFSPHLLIALSFLPVFVQCCYQFSNPGSKLISVNIQQTHSRIICILFLRADSYAYTLFSFVWNPQGMAYFDARHTEINIFIVPFSLLFFFCLCSPEKKHCLNFLVTSYLHCVSSVWFFIFFFFFTLSLFLQIPSLTRVSLNIFAKKRSGGFTKRSNAT